MTQESALIDELVGKYDALPPEKRAKMDALVQERSDGRLWFPTPGPQFDAVKCSADVLLYGGSGGSGKTDLILGLAFTEHQKTLIIRKHYTDLTGLTDRAKEINGSDKGYNGSKPRLTTAEGRIMISAVSQNPATRITGRVGRTTSSPSTRWCRIEKPQFAF